jgi:hypothetical protein
MQHIQAQYRIVSLVRDIEIVNAGLLKGDVLDVLGSLGFALAIAIMLAEKSIARICCTYGAWTMAVEPVPQPNSSTFILGLKIVPCDLEFFLISGFIRDRLFGITVGNFVPKFS